MQRLSTAPSAVLFAASLLGLAACGTTPATNNSTPPAAAAPATASVKTEEEAMTGSRIPKRGSGDRAVNTIGAREARDSFDNMAKPMDR